MSTSKRVWGVTLLGLAGWLSMSFPAQAASQDDLSTLKQDAENLRKRLAAKNLDTKSSGPIGRADATIANKYGPNARVTTKDGKLTIGGLVQVWWYSIQNDNLGAYSMLDRKFNTGLAGIPSPIVFPARTANVQGWNTNQLNDNDSYRVRRAELKFSLDITKEVTAVVMLDPTGGDEANTFPGIPTNQGVVSRTAVGTGGQIDLNEADDAIFLTLFTNVIPTSVGRLQQRRMQDGFMRSNRVLQDAYINYHSSIIPHHDFTLGQFKPPMGEEGNRNSGQLDFVERSMISQFSNQRDLGIMTHGTWWNDRFQYWIGGFDAAGSFQNTFASQQNRSDDNDAKDLAWKFLVRPVWENDDCSSWGHLELGYSRQDGVHGESGNGAIIPDGGAGNTLRFSVDGLSLRHTSANRQYAWIWYRPGGPVKGWWLRGEWGAFNDRAVPGLWNVSAPQLAPHPYRREGWYFSTGYKLSDSVWADTLKGGGFIMKALHDMEFAYRYEVFGNIVSDSVTGSKDGGFNTFFAPGAALYSFPVHTDVFKTQVHTAGVNYYWKGYNVRTQLNYLWVDEPQGHVVTTQITNPSGAIFGPVPVFTGRRFREVRNNVFVISHQVMW